MRLLSLCVFSSDWKSDLQRANFVEKHPYKFLMNLPLTSSISVRNNLHNSKTKVGKKIKDNYYTIP